MSGNHSVSNQADREEGLDEQPKVKWGFAAAVVIAIVLLAILAGFAMFSGAPHHPASDGPTPTQVVQTAPAQAEPVACPAFSREHQSCTFGQLGTQAIGYGEDTGGLYYCIDKPYSGNDALYRLEYRDPNTGEWKDKAVTPPTGSVSTQRFIASVQGNVTLTYWLSETCGATQNESSQTDASDTTDEPVEIIHIVP